MVYEFNVSVNKIGVKVDEILNKDIEFNMKGGD